ncbi:hypothetical protein KUTeg_009669 [Tegillarca granosa]|uniref:Uncharacterized protein n=1 Tax=Tegillarca granosa TaxID=220873 RepID=A0ABQ9F7W4_TEGGR|nr:hypothetical protein KUTeg_009669 [Tegillarca granosa]
MAMSHHITIESENRKIKLAVLGAPGVGKSSITMNPRTEKEVYFPSVIINDHLYELKIIDCPYIPYFPVNSLYEWTDFRGYGLRNATAYILVYDITSEDSFQYIKTIRDQILDSRDMHDVPNVYRRE